MQPSSTPISDLPPELLHQILTHLPISDLLAFSRTCKRHYSASILALQNLELAILPKRVQGLLAFLNASNFDHQSTSFDADSLSHHQIIIPSTLPSHLHTIRRYNFAKSPPVPFPSPVQYREELFQYQNALTCSILSTPSLVNLESLTLHTYTIISPCLAETIATRFPRLRHLHLNFNHPYLHDSCLPAYYFTSPLFLKGSPLWNALVGLGREHEAKLRLTRLERLTVERAGITSVQLRTWIEKNPDLRELTLRNVMGVDDEFVTWLGEYHRNHMHLGTDTGLKYLALESCANLSLRTVEDFGWLDALTGTGTDTDHDQQTCNDLVRQSDSDSKTTVLEALSFHGTPVSTLSLLKYLEKKHHPLRQIGLPSGRLLVAAPTSPETTTSGTTTTSVPDQQKEYFARFPPFFVTRIGPAAIRSIPAATQTLNGGHDPEPIDPDLPAYYRIIGGRPSTTEYDDAKFAGMRVIEPDTR